MNTVKKLIKLYDKCTSINDITSTTIDYQIFKDDKDIKFCNMQDKSLFPYIPLGSDNLVQSFPSYADNNCSNHHCQELPSFRTKGCQ